MRITELHELSICSAESFLGSSFAPIVRISVCQCFSNFRATLIGSIAPTNVVFFSSMSKEMELIPRERKKTTSSEKRTFDEFKNSLHS